VKIANVFGGHPDPVPLGKRGEPLESSPAETAASAASPAAGSARSTTALRQILAKYNVAEITPTQFSEMAQKLFDSGAISQQEFHDLAAVRVDLDAAGIESDQSVNLVEMYRNKVKQAQSRSDDGEPAASKQLPVLLKRLDWVEKFAAMHAQPDMVGLSALA
jgi:hypothetical protein